MLLFLKSVSRQVAARQRIATQLESRGDDSLVGVLVRLARSEQVADEPSARGAEGDLGDHRGSTKLDPTLKSSFQNKKLVYQYSNRI